MSTDTMERPKHWVVQITEDGPKAVDSRSKRESAEKFAEREGIDAFEIVRAVTATEAEKMAGQMDDLDPSPEELEALITQTDVVDGPATLLWGAGRNEDGLEISLETFEDAETAVAHMVDAEGFADTEVFVVEATDGATALLIAESVRGFEPGQRFSKAQKVRKRETHLVAPDAAAEKVEAGDGQDIYFLSSSRMLHASESCRFVKRGVAEALALPEDRQEAHGMAWTEEGIVAPSGRKVSNVCRFCVGRTEDGEWVPAIS